MRLEKPPPIRCIYVTSEPPGFAPMSPQKPPKPHATPTRDCHASCAPPAARCVTICHLQKTRPQRLKRRPPRAFLAPLNHPQQKKKARGHASAGLQKNPGMGEPASSGLLLSLAAARQSVAAPLTPPAPSPHSPQPSSAACPPRPRRAHTSRTTPRPSRSRRSSPCRSGSTRCSGFSPSPRTSAAAC